MKFFLFFAEVVVIVDPKVACFTAYFKSLPNLFQPLGIGPNPFSSKYLVAPDGPLILLIKKFFGAYYSGFSDFETIFSILPFY